jgi:hypothetical protein
VGQPLDWGVAITMEKKYWHSLWHQHSLSIVTGGILVLLACLYMRSNPQTHWGVFLGDAIADWSGALLTIVATKYLYEKGSAESRRLPAKVLRPGLEWLRDHSLSIFLLLSGLAWLWLYVSMDAQSRWGQVLGNLFSEWTQVFVLVLMTKRLIERHSKESNR